MKLSSTFAFLFSVLLLNTSQAEIDFLVKEDGNDVFVQWCGSVDSSQLTTNSGSCRGPGGRLDWSNQFGFAALTDVECTATYREVTKVTNTGNSDVLNDSEMLTVFADTYDGDPFGVGGGETTTFLKLPTNYNSGDSVNGYLRIRFASFETLGFLDGRSWTLTLPSLVTPTNDHIVRVRIDKDGTSLCVYPGNTILGSLAHFFTIDFPRFWFVTLPRFFSWLFGPIF